MCELFGATSRESCCVNDFLKIFFSRSVNHPHGWGLATIDGPEVIIEKEPMQASKSNYLKERLSLPVESKTIFAHIRYATIGNIDYKNCHPYTKKDNSGRRWTLIHNGTIFDYPPLNKYLKLQTGDTDSERILLYLVDLINAAQREKNGSLSFEERVRLINSIIPQMAKGNKLNLLLSDGKYIYVHSNYLNSIHTLERDNCTLFSTEPLTNDDWKPIKFATLLAYRDGRLVYTGTTHDNEYVDNEESMKFLYQIFSDL